MNNVFLFDFDGVLGDSFNYTCSRFIPIFEKYGVKSSPEDIRVLHRGNINLEIVKLVGKEHFDEFAKLSYGSFDPSNISLFPGIKKLLQQCISQGTVVIITSNKTNIVQTVLENNKIAKDVEILGYDVEKSKTKKINSMKAKYPNSHYLYIGDTTGDVQEAKEAGVVSIAVTYGYHKREWLEEAKPDYLANSVEELKEILLADINLIK